MLFPTNHKPVTQRSRPFRKGELGETFRQGLVGIGLLLALVALSGAAAAQDAGRGDLRVALVIGNSTYINARLRNPINDAEAVAAGLRESGFQVVLRRNTTRRELTEALREFFLVSTRSTVRLLFYAGHGIQSKGRNYLLPVDAELISESELPQQAIDMTEFLDRLATVKSGVNLVILDACRNNPFGAIASRLAYARARTRSLGGSTPSGLARVTAPSGTLIAYSTAPGAVAMDGADQENSIYTKHLLRWLNTPGLPVERLFKQVRIDVAHETQYEQVPWETSSLTGEFCFKAGAEGACGM